MGDIEFKCNACGGALVVDERGVGLRVACPHCSGIITIPQKPVWLPKINSLIARLAQDLVRGYSGEKATPGSSMNLARARMELKQGVLAAGYHPGTAGVFPDSPEDISNSNHIEIVLHTNEDLIRGFKLWEKNADRDHLDVFPAQELEAIFESESEMDWASRWVALGGRLVGHKRMVALKSDPIWNKLSIFGLPYPPYAFDSGMWVKDVSLPEAMRLGMIKNQNATALDPQYFSAPMFLPIEDERLINYLREQVDDEIELESNV